MNQNQVGPETFIQTITGLGSKFAILVGTIIFWLMLIALISSPAWIPMVVETLIRK